MTDLMSRRQTSKLVPEVLLLSQRNRQRGRQERNRRLEHTFTEDFGVIASALKECARAETATVLNMSGLGLFSGREAESSSMF